MGGFDQAIPEKIPVERFARKQRLDA